MTAITSGRFGRWQFGRRLAIALAGFAIGAIVVLFAAEQWHEMPPPKTPTVLTIPPANPSGPTVRTAPTSPSAPTKPASLPAPNIQVVDGDTVRTGGAVYRLVGFDAPESGSNASCLQEDALAQRATQRLRQLILEGDVQLTRVACACRPGTEGTRNCNFGRLCGRLTARGRDVAGIMIGEGLARPFVCGTTSCPRRQSWCG
jgi:endonuclease YncB( thermonuclease family)